MELLRRSTAIFRPRTSQFVNPRRFAGHNKWSKIKHRKATADMGKSKLVAKLTREIRAAVREGGADTNHNLQLASAVSKAREMDIPKATIQAAINIASGDHGGGEKVMVEARGRAGYGLVIETVTDNKQRTRQQIQRILVKNGYQTNNPEAKHTYESLRKIARSVAVSDHQLIKIFSDHYSHSQLNHLNQILYCCL